MPGIVGFRSEQPLAKPAAIVAGSTYTYYALDSGPEKSTFCEILTFSSGTFTGDRGTVGTWTSSPTKATVKFTNSAFFYAGTFIGTYETSDALSMKINQYGGSFKIVDKSAVSNKESYGPDALVQGSDPWDVGGC